jgi:transcriptional regulator with AAA-type ATPase domain
MQNKNTT